MTTCLEGALHLVYCTCLSICVCASFSICFEGGMWYLIVLVPGHCFSFYFALENSRNSNVTLTFSILSVWETAPSCINIS